MIHMCTINERTHVNKKVKSQGLISKQELTGTLIWYRIENKGGKAAMSDKTHSAMDPTTSSRLVGENSHVNYQHMVLDMLSQADTVKRRARKAP